VRAAAQQLQHTTQQQQLAGQQQRREQQQQRSSSSITSRLASAAGAAVVAVGISLAAPTLTAQAATLADVSRDLFAFVDDKDGVISRCAQLDQQGP
jgi:transcription initiation factor TFIID subunit TAF12